MNEREDLDYWRDNKELDSVPDRLQELLEIWRYQPPSRYDFIQNEEVFPSASYQYVLYGMKFSTKCPSYETPMRNSEVANKMYTANQGKMSQIISVLPTNRHLINQLKQRFC
ncbi:MAG: tryptophan 7-halogenase [Paraglaciecola sp.]